MLLDWCIVNYVCIILSKTDKSYHILSGFVNVSRCTLMLCLFVVISWYSAAFILGCCHPWQFPSYSIVFGQGWEPTFGVEVHMREKMLPNSCIVNYACIIQSKTVNSYHVLLWIGNVSRCTLMMCLPTAISWYSSALIFDPQSEVSSNIRLNCKMKLSRLGEVR